MRPEALSDTLTLRNAAAAAARPVRTPMAGVKTREWAILMATTDRGFASMDPDKQREIATKCGKEGGTSSETRTCH
jgi:hypothetical protein